MPTLILDIEQHLLLLELEAPFDKREVQLARRRMAKRWHPDLAPQGTRVGQHVRKGRVHLAQGVEIPIDGTGNVSRRILGPGIAVHRGQILLSV